MKIGKIERLGLALEIFASAIVILLVLSNQQIPDIVAWIFLVGMIAVFGGSLNTLSKRKNSD